MENKLLLSKTNDLFFACKKNASAKFSPFLNSAEQAEIEDNAVIPYEFNTMFFGGYDEAERKMLGVFPEWEEADAAAFPIKILRFRSRFLDGLTHRDFLGSLMAQGVDRNKTGDILIDGDTAYVFVCADMAAYFADNIKKIGSRGVRSDVCDVSEVRLPKPKTEDMRVICASLRLDAVTAAACGLSRAASAKLISAGLVSVNHRETENASYNVKDGDLLSVRGHGRFVFVSSDGETAKGRLHITVKKYI